MVRQRQLVRRQRDRLRRRPQQCRPGLDGPAAARLEDSVEFGRDDEGEVGIGRRRAKCRRFVVGPDNI